MVEVFSPTSIPIYLIGDSLPSSQGNDVQFSSDITTQPEVAGMKVKVNPQAHDLSLYANALEVKIAGTAEYL